MMDKNSYDDIIHYEYPRQLKHKRMSRSERAAQFSPFAALQGHSESIQERARLTNDKIILDENAKMLLNEKILNLLETHKKAIYIYFEKDLQKDGGQYVSYEGNLKRIDEIRQVLIFYDKKEIRIHDIYDIQSDSFVSIT